MNPKCWPRCPAEFVATTEGLRREHQRRILPSRSAAQALICTKGADSGEYQGENGECTEINTNNTCRARFVVIVQGGLEVEVNCIIIIILLLLMNIKYQFNYC